MAAMLLFAAPTVRATIPSVVSTSFSLTASAGYVSVPDGGSIYAWGYSVGSAMQLPGPTLEVTAGQSVTVTLTNALPAAAGNVSIVFQGQQVTTVGRRSGPPDPGGPARRVRHLHVHAEPTGDLPL